MTQMIPILDSLPDLTWKEKLAYLTTRFLNEEQVEAPVTHLFEGDKYIREMRIPKDTLFIGRPHRYGHECVLVEGSLVHITETFRRVVEAPFSMVTQPGYQMVLYTLTDVVGRTIHPNSTQSRDSQALEDDIFETLDSMKALGHDVAHRMEALCRV